MKKHSKNWRHKTHLPKLLISAGVVVGLLVALWLTNFGINAANNQRPIIGLRVEGQTISRLFGSAPKKQVENIIATYENTPITVKAAGLTSKITLRQLGVRTDRDQVYTEIMQIGRSGSLFQRLYDQDRAQLGNMNVTLKKPIDTALAKKYIASLNKRIAKPPANAHFAFIGQNAVVRTDTAGRQLNAEAALSRLKQANPFEETSIDLPIKHVPAAVTLPMLTSILSEVQNIAQQPLSITAGNAAETLSRKELVSLIVPKIIPDPKDPDKQVARVSFNEKKLRAIIDKLLGQVVKDATSTIVSGGTVIQQGASGVQADGNHAMVQVLSALTKRQTGAAMPGKVGIPLASIEPPVVHQAPASSSSYGGGGSNTGTGLVRLTFDDGPAAYTEQILNVLSQYGVHATFYVLGSNSARSPGTLQRIRDEGHAIANHSYSHANLTYLSAAGVSQELSDTQAVIQQVAGVTPTGFRPPYGALNATVHQVAAGLGLSVDLWSIDPQDWAQPGSSVITQRVLSGVGPGAVVLLHDLYQQTVDALPSIIEGIRAQGYTLE